MKYKKNDEVSYKSGNEILDKAYVVYIDNNTTDLPYLISNREHTIHKWSRENELTPVNKRPTRRELKQHIKELEKSNIILKRNVWSILAGNNHELCRKEIDELKQQLAEKECNPVAIVDVEELCRVTVEAHTEELEKQLADKTEEARSYALELKLTKEACYVLKALRRMPKGATLVANGESWSLWNGKDRNYNNFTELISMFTASGLLDDDDGNMKCMCSPTAKVQTEELQQQNTKLQSDIIDRDRLIAEAKSTMEALVKESEGLQEQIKANDVTIHTLSMSFLDDTATIAKLKQQLADARQATRTLQALEKMGTHCELFHRQGSLNPWCIFRGSYDLIGEGNTINEAVLAAGLLTETEESNADTKD